MGYTLRELQEGVPKEWLRMLEDVKHLLEDLPPEGGQSLFELWKQIPERRTGQEGLRSFAVIDIHRPILG